MTSFDIVTFMFTGYWWSFIVVIIGVLAGVLFLLLIVIICDSYIDRKDIVFFAGFCLLFGTISASCFYSNVRFTSIERDAFVVDLASHGITEVKPSSVSIGSFFDARDKNGQFVHCNVSDYREDQRYKVTCSK